MDLTPGPEPRERVSWLPVADQARLYLDEREMEIVGISMEMLEQIRAEAYRAGREDAARDIAEVVAPKAGDRLLLRLTSDMGGDQVRLLDAALRREYPDVDFNYVGGGVESVEVNQPRTPLVAETTDTESSPEVERLRRALAEAANAQCGCLGGTLLEYSE